MTTREYMAARLKEFRNAKGMSVVEVGKLVGKSDKTISAWEVGRGQPDADMLVRLCQIFEVEISDFYQKTSESMSLTPNEERLVVAYRQLDEGQQSTVLGMVEGLANK